MENYWNYHDKQMVKLKQLYVKTSKQTQNKLQEIIDTFKFNFDTLYNIADKKTKDRVNTYIEEWKDKGLLTGYFGTLAKNIYGRTRVKNSEILELLIYGAYIEEQSKLKGQELNIMYDDANYYYQEGQQEVNNALPKKERKPINILKWALFLALLDQPNVKGYVYEQYIQAIIQYNAQQIYRQITIDLQQQKEIGITNDIYQNLIKRQNNSKLNINEDKISGDIDTQLIGVNNLAKVEGIKKVDNNAQVRFIAIIDGKETDMCHSLDGQLFYINKENVFNRYYGETQKDLRIERIKCKGLVVGLNLPPISHHFHWCRSSITYQVPIENEEKTEYNGLASSSVNTIEEHPEPKLLEKIDSKNEKEILECLEKYEKTIRSEDIENAIVVTKNGEVYQCFGNNSSVWVDYDLKEKLNEAYITHNHPENETQYSFSEDDIALFNNYNLKILRGTDNKYTYELTRNPKEIDEIAIEDLMNEENGMHAINISRASRMNIGYRRWKND